MNVQRMGGGSSHHRRGGGSIPEEEEYSERGYHHYGYDDYSDDYTEFTESSSSLYPTNFPAGKFTNNKSEYDLITIFQAAPLAGINSDGNLAPIAELNIEEERKHFNRIFDCRVQVEFQIATQETLGKFLETKQGSLLHFSCHGEADCLYLEDEWGGLADLDKKHLKKWVELGGQKLQFVFVSACYSQEIGQAFVDAGVPHVVCSREKLRVGVSTLFEKTFYRNLVQKKTVQKAFDCAIHDTSINTKIPENLRQHEVEKYCLLGNADHNVPVFFQQPSKPQQQPPQPPTRRPERLFPPPPKVFIGRAVDQYKILQHVKQSRLTCVHGPSGMGKTALIKAVCQYVFYRMNMMDLSDIQWVDTSEERLRSEEHNHHFQPIIDLIHQERTSCRKFLEQAGEHIVKLVKTFQHRKTLLVVNAKRINQKDSLKKLGIFLEEFINRTENVKFIVIYKDGDGIKASKLRGEHQVYSVGPLTFEWSARLFAKLLPEELLDKRRYGIGTSQGLCEWLIGKTTTGATSTATTTTAVTGRQKIMWERMGSGDPGFTVDVAKTFTKDQYEDLLRLCRNKDDDNDLTLESLRGLNTEIEDHENLKDMYEQHGNMPYIEKCKRILHELYRKKEPYSRASLERRQKQLQKVIDAHKKKKNLLKAFELESKQRELEAIKVQQPTLIQLEYQREELEFEIKLASNNDLLRAQQLQIDLKITIKAIEAERNSFGDTDIPESRALLEARIMKMQAEEKRCIAVDDFSKLKVLKPEIDRLKEMRSMVPSAEDLRIRISRLNESLDMAKQEKDWDSAETLQSRKKAIEAKLRTEEEAEISHGVQVPSEKIPEAEEQSATSTSAASRRSGGIDPGDDPVINYANSSSTASTGASDPPGLAVRSDSRRSDPTLEWKKGSKDRYSASNMSLRAPARNAMQTIVPSMHESDATVRHSNRARHSQSSQESARRPDPSDTTPVIGPGAYAVRGESSRISEDDDNQGSAFSEEETNPAPAVAQSVAAERDIVLPIMASASSPLPSALQVVDDVMEDQERLEQQIVQIMKKHAVQAESVVPVPEPGIVNKDISVDFSEYSDRSRNTDSLRDSLESEEKKGGMKALFKKLRNRKS